MSVKDSANSQDLTNNLGKVLRRAERSAPVDHTRRNDIYAYGLRDSIGLAFDPLSGTGRRRTPGLLDERPARARRRYGRGPNHNCHEGTPPDNTNNSGPDPIFPQLWYTPTIAPTGITFCNGCGLGVDSEGALFFGTFNTPSHPRALYATRENVVSSEVIWTDPSVILHMESGPDGSVYFSDASGVYKLALTP